MNIINTIPKNQINLTNNKTNKSQSKTYYNVLPKASEKKDSYLDTKRLVLLAFATLSLLAIVKSKLKFKLPKKNVTQVVQADTIEFKNIDTPITTKIVDFSQIKVRDSKPKVANPFNLNRKETPVQVKINECPQEQRNNSIKEISILLKPTMKSMSKNRVFNPNEIDELLTKYVGKKQTREIRFFTDEKRGIYEGRKKSYKANDGRIYILEAHSCPKGVVTRLYLAINPNKKPLMKDNRLYLTGKGYFVRNSYFQRFTHLVSGEHALQWIRNVGNVSVSCKR